jgi:hypothetical protein
MALYGLAKTLQRTGEKELAARYAGKCYDSIQDSKSEFDRALLDMVVANWPELRNRKWFRGFASMVVAILILFALPFFWHVIHRIDPKSVEAAIDQNLDLGADVETVIRYLDSQGIWHSGYSPDIGTVAGSIEQASFYGIEGRIRIVFRFDQNRKLVSYEVGEMFDFL